MTNILIYTRLSTVDLKKATERQEAACRAYCDAREWTVLQVRSDVAASAYDPHQKRPGFEALFHEADQRTCDGILVWKFDRLVRRPSDFERLWNVTERSGVFLASVMEPIDTSTPLGLAMLRILVALAGLESATMGVRISAAKRRAAEQGKHQRRRAYGLTHDGAEIDPGEAAVIREAATRVLANERISHIVRDFRARGIAGPRSESLSETTLARLLRSPRLVGDQTHRGAVVARDCLPPVLDRDTWGQLQVALARPDRQGRPQTMKRRLAAGFATCGYCGTPLKTNGRAAGQPAYACPRPPYGCSRLSVDARAVDEWLLEQLAQHFRRHIDWQPAARTNLHPPEIAASLEQLSVDYYVNGAISRDEFFSARAELVRATDHPAPITREQWVDRVMRARDRRAAIARLSTERQRLLLEEFAETVVVGPVPVRGRSVFDPARLTLRWRDAGVGAVLAPRRDTSVAGR